MIKVMLVDDSPVVLTILTRMLAQSPELTVVGTARDGGEALRLIQSVNPDVICTDLEMPGMDGYSFIDAVMRTTPRPILVVSSHVQREHTVNIFRALELGAIDIFPKMRGGMDDADRADASELARKIRVLSGVKPFLRRHSSSQGLPAPARGECPPQARIVAIGASTGGPQALYMIFESLQEPLPVPLLCVQHINRDFYQSLVDWLQPVAPMPLRIARDQEMPAAGTIYFPQPDRHLLVDSSGRLINGSDPPIDGHRPSVSATFRSVAEQYGSAAMGVLLTGMGRDGAEGLLAISKAGGITVAQDEGSSVVFGMAREAIELGAAKHIVPLNRVGELLVRHTGTGSR